MVVVVGGGGGVAALNFSKAGGGGHSPIFGVRNYCLIPLPLLFVLGVALAV